MLGKSCVGYLAFGTAVERRPCLVAQSVHQDLGGRSSFPGLMFLPGWGESPCLPVNFHQSCQWENQHVTKIQESIGKGDKRSLSLFCFWFVVLFCFVFESEFRCVCLAVLVLAV